MIPIYSRFKFGNLNYKTLDHRFGFTLIELLVALAIVALLILLMSLGQGLQLSRGEDARRKTDLAKLKVVFEDYYNDHNCYPSPALLSRCNSSDLVPYLAKVPCDPRTKLPYDYYRDSTCSWYAVYTTLGDTNDPVIPTLGCFPTCGVTNKSYNYIQTNGAITPVQTAGQVNSGAAEGFGNQVGGTPTPTPTSLPTPSPSVQPTSIPTPTPIIVSSLACDPSGQCNLYQDPVGNGCPTTYLDASTCQQACSNPANRCAR